MNLAPRSVGANTAAAFSGVPESGLHSDFRNSNVMAMMEGPPFPILVNKTYYLLLGTRTS